MCTCAYPKIDGSETFVAEVHSFCLAEDRFSKGLRSYITEITCLLEFSTSIFSSVLRTIFLMCCNLLHYQDSTCQWFSMEWVFVVMACVKQCLMLCEHSLSLMNPGNVIPCESGFKLPSHVIVEGMRRDSQQLLGLDDYYQLRHERICCLFLIRISNVLETNQCRV